MVSKKIKDRARRKKLSQQLVSSPSIISTIDYPIFCFHHLATNKYDLANCNKEERASCLNTLRILSKNSWYEIESNHIEGFHKIKDKDSIRARRPEPTPISPDLPIIAFDFHDGQTMVGYRRECVFHIIWLDRDFPLYDHGS